MSATSEVPPSTDDIETVEWAELLESKPPGVYYNVQNLYRAANDRQFTLNCQTCNCTAAHNRVADLGFLKHMDR